MSMTKGLSNEDVKNNILQLLRTVSREGVEDLISWLVKKSDFFTAPASTRYHLAEEGGLSRHSLNVYYRLLSLLQTERDTYGLQNFSEIQDSIILTALLHDVCKTGFYKPGTRNVKNEATGAWEKVPCYTIEDSLPYGHGEKSVYILSGFIKLTREEAMAIRWHMGGFDEAVKGGSRAMDAAFSQFPLAVCLHVADLLASHLDEEG